MRTPPSYMKRHELLPKLCNIKSVRSALLNKQAERQINATAAYLALLCGLQYAFITQARSRLQAERESMRAALAT